MPCIPKPSTASPCSVHVWVCTEAAGGGTHSAIGTDFGPRQHDSRLSHSFIQLERISHFFKPHTLNLQDGKNSTENPAYQDKWAPKYSAA